MPIGGLYSIVRFVMTIATSSTLQQALIVCDLSLARSILGRKSDLNHNYVFDVETKLLETF